MRRLATRMLACAVLTASFSNPALATYPDRPISLVVSSTAGGPLDVLGRLLATEAAKDLGQTVIVENKAGASGMIAADHVARSKPDGHTFLLTLDTTATVNPAIYPKTNVDVTTALTPVSFLGSFDQVLVVNKHLGVSNLGQLAEASKKRVINYASAGIGSPGHLTMEAFKLSSRMPLTHVPYRGNGPAVNDLLGGLVDGGFLVTAGVLPHIKQGSFIPLAVSGAKRNPLLPDVPTLAESGIKGLERFDVNFGYIVLAPKGTPQPIIDRWNSLLQDILRRPAAVERFKILDIQASFTGPEHARDWISSNSAKWSEVIKAAGISINQ